MTTERDIRNQIQYARDKGLVEGLEKGMAAGIQKGMEKGRKEGIEQGIEQGRAEKEKQIALNLIANGFDIPTIIRITGLTEEEVLAAQR